MQGLGDCNDNPSVVTAAWDRSAPSRVCFPGRFRKKGMGLVIIGKSRTVTQGNNRQSNIKAFCICKRKECY